MCVGAVKLSDHHLVQALLPRCTFPEVGASLRCGWSGGADSTALVVLAIAAGCRVIVEGGAALGLSAEMAANADLAARPAMVGALIELVRGFAVQARDTK